MHKRFAIALQTVRGIARGASGRGGPGLGNGGKPARWCGDLVFSDGSETGRRQPESLADVSEPRWCQPESLADVPEPWWCQPESLADVSEPRQCQPESLADVSELRWCQPESLADVPESRRCQPESLADVPVPSERGFPKPRGHASGNRTWSRWIGTNGALESPAPIRFPRFHYRSSGESNHIPPLQGLVLFLPRTLGFTQGYYIPHLRRSNAPRRLKSLTTFAARQSAAHLRHAKLG